MSALILAHDLGTSGNKATLYDPSGTLVASCLAEYPTYYPRSGWAEQDAEDWWAAVCASTRGLLEAAGVAPGDVACVCFSAQMMGCLLVDRAGDPLHRMLTWADTRAGEQEAEMIRAVGAEAGYRVIGHRVSASYGAAKLLWIKAHAPEVYRRAYKMLNAKDFIIHRLTGRFLTDYSDASGTNLLDLEGKTWSQALVSAWGVRADLLPELVPSSAVAGGVTDAAAAATGLLPGTPVVVGGGDGSCACVGAGVTAAGRAYNVLGSSSWISLASPHPRFDPEMRCFNWVHLDEGLYTPCGTMQAAGLSYHWLRQTLGAEEAERARAAGESAYALLNRRAEASPPGARGLVYLPYLLGERSPRWNHSARGAYVGVNIATTKDDFVRATLEGVGMNLKLILDLLEGGDPLPEITVIGGGAQGETWLQILADIWQRPLAVPAYLKEATSLGAAVCGGVGVGLYPDFSAAGRLNPATRRVLPCPERAGLYREMMDLFESAYQGLCPTYERLHAMSDILEG